MGVIFFLSAQPSLPGPQDLLLDAIMKKLGHVTLYAILMVLLLRATVNKQARWHAIALCLFGVVAYGLSDEYHQTFVAHRTPAITDVLFDTAGGMTGAIFWQALRIHLQPVLPEIVDPTPSSGKIEDEVPLDSQL